MKIALAMVIAPNPSVTMTVLFAGEKHLGEYGVIPLTARRFASP